MDLVRHKSVNNGNLHIIPTSASPWQLSKLNQLNQCLKRSAQSGIGPIPIRTDRRTGARQLATNTHLERTDYMTTTDGRSSMPIHWTNAWTELQSCIGSIHIWTDRQTDARWLNLDRQTDARWLDLYGRTTR